jgi:hypothetical protein
VNISIVNLITSCPYGIIHQTITCECIKTKWGGREKEWTFSLGRSSQPAADLINRMPFRDLGHKTPHELLHGSNSFIVHVLIKQMFWLLVDNFSKSSLVMEGQRGGDIFLIDLNLN